MNTLHMYAILISLAVSFFCFFQTELLLNQANYVKQKTGNVSGARIAINELFNLRRKWRKAGEKTFMITALLIVTPVSVFNPIALIW